MTVAAGADLKSVNRYGGTALTPAAHHGHVKVVAYLVTTKIDVDQVNFLGWTALLEAVILGDGGPIHQKIVKILLKAGADKKITDNNGKTPLQHAWNLGFKKIVALLKQHGN
jgi:ankyrin repeat protein